MRAERTFERKVEHRIACEDGDGIAQPVERLPDRARRTQRRRFAEIADVQPRRTQRLDLLGAEHRRHRNAGDPAIAQCVKDTLNGGPARNRHERLGSGFGYGKQPRSHSTGKNGGGQPGMHHHIHLHSAALRRRQTPCHTARRQKPRKTRIEADLGQNVLRLLKRRIPFRNPSGIQSSMDSFARLKRTHLLLKSVFH